ncbi:hypothetical protein NDU88_002681 [Pleurodeles waltl]|uniref:Uncharacterized protein n=1 Tax=Pleurodeles waltl TaxID=8319 RepID=A0AAV7LGC4_PLEWA|nr:hypothetical protein NDU88_002681 [Pleurodeles waltl]
MWRLRPEALMDAPFDTAVRDFEVNWGTSTTNGCDWEAMKVVIRESLRADYPWCRRQPKKDVPDHESMLRDLEKCLLMQPQRMEEWQQARRLLLEDWRRLERYVYKAYRQHLHAGGDKAVVHLACLIKQHADHMPVTPLVDVAGRRVCTQVAINTVFQDHLDRPYALPEDGGTGGGLPK